MGPIPTNENDRLAALDSYDILDTAAEDSFDDLTDMAAAICGVPISLVSFVTGDRQWFKSTLGLRARETSREVSFCAHTLVTKQTLVVPDATLDPRFQNNALVTGQPEIRFYAGAPIIERNGHALGTVCVIDTKPRHLSERQIRALEALARQAGSLLEQKRLAKTTQLALASAQRTQEQLALAIEAADLAAWFYYPVENIVWGDARMSMFFGLSQSSAPAEVWLSAVSAEDRERVTNEFAASLMGAAYDTTYCVRSNSGSRWLHAKAQTITRPDGSSLMVGICEDVTHEKVLAANLMRTAERLSLAQGASGAATFDWDLEHDVITWGSDCFHRPSSELPTSREVFALIHEEDRVELGNIVTAALQSGEGYSHEFRVTGPLGELLWYYTSGKPLKDEHGRITSVVGANLDITKRKLTEQALLQTEKLAAVGRLASTIAHEINNPLESVTNLLYLSRNAAKELEVSGWLAQADSELRRVSAIVNQTLRFHRQSSRPQAMTSKTLFANTLNLYEARFSNSKIAVEERDRLRAPLVCFEGDVRQVLSNLVANAIDAMPNGGRLLVRSRAGTDWKTGRKGLYLTIADTGIGMDVRTQDRVFDAFYTTKGIGGTGLGLWVSAEIMQRHAGRILLRSSQRNPHRGTVITLFFPD